MGKQYLLSEVDSVVVLLNDILEQVVVAAVEY